MKPGVKTSDLYLTIAVKIVGVALTAFGVQHEESAVHEIAGLALIALSHVSYLVSRTTLKVKEMKLKQDADP